eukprot:1416016-Pleurochrysis_carterae.AAC.1
MNGKHGASEGFRRRARAWTLDEKNGQTLRGLRKVWTRLPKERTEGGEKARLCSRIHGLGGCARPSGEHERPREGLKKSWRMSLLPPADSDRERPDSECQKLAQTGTHGTLESEQTSASVCKDGAEA